MNLTNHFILVGYTAASVDVTTNAATSPEPYTHLKFRTDIRPNRTSGDDNANSLPLPYGRGSDGGFIRAATVRERLTAVRMTQLTMVEMFEMRIRFRALSYKSPHSKLILPLLVTA